MIEREWLERLFEEHRAHLEKVALRMLGTGAEVDDAVQEAWLRLSRSDAQKIENVGGWLTTVVARVCLDMLRSRRSRREQPLESIRAEQPLERDEAPATSDPEREMLLADSIGTALLVVLERLEPAERVAFVLHDMFDLPFDEIAAIVGRSEPATRQLASRARRRVRGGGNTPDADRDRRRDVVNAFFAAARDGDVARLLSVLAPDVVVRADDEAVRNAAIKRGYAPDLVSELHGAREVAAAFNGRARGAQQAVIDGEPGAVWAVDGKPRAAYVFTIEDGRIVAIDVFMSPTRLGELDVQLQA